jgi:hypothetical protein
VSVILHSTRLRQLIYGYGDIYLFSLRINLFSYVPCRLNFRLANSKLEKRMRNFEEDRWRDMGVVMITFVVHSALDGAMVVDK